MALYAGRDSRLYMSTTGAGTAIPVANLSSISINMETDTIDVTSFGNSNRVYVQGLKDFSADFDGFWDDTDETMFDAADSSSAPKFYFYPSINAVNRYWYGTAWVSASIETSVDGAVSTSGSLVAAGNITRVWP